MYRESSPPLTEVAGYILSERLGSGGMGDVYKAYHPGLNRFAAVKVLHQREMAERFRNEAFIQSSVNHPHIARLYESRLTGPFPAIVMEYVEGETLDQTIRRMGKIPSELAEKILAQIVSALFYLHSRDILHRDIKPSNFKLQPDGTVKMLDFGIAKHKYSPKLTQQGFIVGTTEYMAPEQFQQRVEKQSDIWSLGVLLYEMTTGHLPFEAVNPVVLQGKICKASFTDPAILVSSLSPKLTGIIEKCLRVNPASRTTAAAIRKQLGAEKPATRVFRLPIKLPAKNVLVGGGVLALALLIMLVLINLDEKVPDIPVKPKPAEQVNNTGDQHRVRVNTPSIPGASIQLSGGESRNLPTEISGKEGERVEFLIRANGYADRTVSLLITSRRSAYDYNLDKLND